MTNQTLAFPKGVHTVLVTPFDSDDNIMWDDMDKWIEYQCASGVAGLVLLGTTSESPTLSRDEQLAIVKHVYAKTAGRKFVTAGVGGNNTKENAEFAKLCADYCDGIMVTAPSYSKPTQQGIIEHFKYISKVVETKPVIIYNIPGRAGVNMEPCTIAEIHELCKNVVAIKEASGSIAQLIKLKSMCSTIQIFSGDDELIMDFVLAHDCDGVISVASNVFPSLINDVYLACENSTKKQAAELYRKYSIHEFCKVLFAVTNPIPVKYMLHKMGLFSEYNMRLPLMPLNTELQKLVTDDMLEELSYYVPNDLKVLKSLNCLSPFLSNLHASV